MHGMKSQEEIIDGHSINAFQQWVVQEATQVKKERMALEKGVHKETVFTL